MSTEFDDAWAQVAQAAAAAEIPKAPTCPHCGTLISVTDGGMIKVHFETATSSRPCPKSYRPHS